MIGAMRKVKGPWIWLADFNCIRYQSEKLNGARVGDADMRELSELCDQTGMFDMAVNRNLFTWSDKHSAGTRIWSKLDRILCNESMMDLIPSIHGFFPNPRISDHCPAIAFLGEKPLIKKWFRFQAFWIFTEEFKRCVSQKWQSGACNLFSLQKSLKASKADLKVAMRNLQRGYELEGRA
ncbi:hypothetical protein QQ045_011808 [Rhodiola kirilowii]